MEKRKKSLSILLRDERKTESKIDLYSALEWPDAPGSGPNLCRVMVDGKWIIFNDEKYTFMTLDAAMNSVELSAWSLLGPCERDFRGWPAQAKPTISIGTPVRIQTGQIAGQKLYDLTRAATDPIQCIDGRWYVGVIMIGTGTVMVPVDTLQVQE